MKILLIDDDEGVRTLLRMTMGLEHPSAEVQECGDALAALDICDRWNPDTIVMDSTYLVQRETSLLE